MTCELHLIYEVIKNNAKDDNKNLFLTRYIASLVLGVP